MTPTEQRNLSRLRELQMHITNLHCRNCSHIIRTKIGKQSLFYCGERPSKFTSNQLLRIKTSDVACPLYSYSEKPYTKVDECKDNG